MLKLLRIAIFAAAGLGLAAATANAMMLGSASRSAGLAIAARVDTAGQDRQATAYGCCAPLTAPAFSTSLYLTLTIVNQLVNNEPVTRPELRAYWPVALLPLEGEAAARAKRERLIRHGLPADALRLTPREDESGRRMVLLVETSAGDFVLDSVSARVTREVPDERRTASIPLDLPKLRFR